jgi:hypothetical protein
MGLVASIILTKWGCHRDTTHQQMMPTAFKPRWRDYIGGEGGMPNISNEQDARIATFIDALNSEDDLGMVVRAHIHIEHELKEFVTAAAPRPDQVKFPDYDGTIRLALVLGLDATLKPALNAIGKLRNKFSHRLGMKLGSQEVNDLFAALSPQHQKMMQEIYKKQGGKNIQAAPIAERVRFVFITLVIALRIQTSLLENGDTQR